MRTVRDWGYNFGCDEGAEFERRLTISRVGIGPFQVVARRLIWRGYKRFLAPRRKALKRALETLSGDEHIRKLLQEMLDKAKRKKET